jgi:hypothetical protein
LIKLSAARDDGRVVFGALLEVARISRLSQASVKLAIGSPHNGFQILAGVGLGLFNVVLPLLMPYVLEIKYLGKF